MDYPALAKNARFYKYLDAIAELDPSTLETREEQLAFWINAYNALAMKNIVDGMSPIDMLGRVKFFRTTEHRVGGRSYDLRSIENDVLADLEEPRVHFAIVPAAYSAATLRSEAYRAESLEQQLEDNTREFINDNRKNRFGLVTGKAKISSIFDDHEKVFGGSERAVMAFIARYVTKKGAAEVLSQGRLEIEFMQYDWSINGRPMP